ncbi:MAG: hypothetical protein JXA66_06440 [Oligoflexia bacterium]|nr:hypothetical protein [Oligoflexia bacterium]
MGVAPYKRRVYLINKDFQIKFIIYTTAIALITIAAFYTMLSFFFQSSIDLGIEAGFPPGHVYFRFIDDSRADMNVYFLITSVSVFILIFISGLLFSHKIAGPIYRMITYLRSISLDKISEKLSFRKKDFFQELSEAYNKRIQYLRNAATHEPDKLIEALKLREGEKTD